jgi:hypothetical protein
MPRHDPTHAALRRRAQEPHAGAPVGRRQLGRIGANSRAGRSPLSRSAGRHGWRDRSAGRSGTCTGSYTDPLLTSPRTSQASTLETACSRSRRTGPARAGPPRSGPLPGPGPWPPAEAARPGWPSKPCSDTGQHSSHLNEGRPPVPQGRPDPPSYASAGRGVSSRELAGSPPARASHPFAVPSSLPANGCDHSGRQPTAKDCEGSRSSREVFYQLPSTPKSAITIGNPSLADRETARQGAKFMRRLHHD